MLYLNFTYFIFGKQIIHTRYLDEADYSVFEFLYLISWWNFCGSYRLIEIISLAYDDCLDSVRWNSSPYQRTLQICSLSDNSNSDSSDSNISSLHEVNFPILNETQNVALTTERENRNQRAGKEKVPWHNVGKDIKPNCYEIRDTYIETLKELLKYLNRRYVPLWGHV